MDDREKLLERLERLQNKLIPHLQAQYDIKKQAADEIKETLDYCRRATHLIKCARRCRCEARLFETSETRYILARQFEIDSSGLKPAIVSFAGQYSPEIVPTQTRPRAVPDDRGGQTVTGTEINGPDYAAECCALYGDNVILAPLYQAYREPCTWCYVPCLFILVHHLDYENHRQTIKLMQVCPECGHINQRASIFRPDLRDFPFLPTR